MSNADEAAGQTAAWAVQAEPFLVSANSGQRNIDDGEHDLPFACHAQDAGKNSDTAADNPKQRP